MSRKKALICGVSGQDGAYLTELLLSKGYEVFGTSRDAELCTFERLDRLGLLSAVHTLTLLPTDFRSVMGALLRVEPDEVYNLAGQTSVGRSFQQPFETLESIAVGTLNFLEAIRLLGRPIRYYNACSSECFGEVPGAANEETPLRPRSPYGVAKAAAHWAVVNYREAYDLFAVSGLLFNHESPLRPQRFVTQKVVRAACRIARGEAMAKLRLGRLDVQRDWGWAPEYVRAMQLMLAAPEPQDYVIATGSANSLERFVDLVFRQLGLDWKAWVETGSEFFRPSDIGRSVGDPAKAEIDLGWTAEFDLEQIVAALVSAELERNGDGARP